METVWQSERRPNKLPIDVNKIEISFLSYRALHLRDQQPISCSAQSAPGSFCLSESLSFTRNKKWYMNQEISQVKSSSVLSKPGGKITILIILWQSKGHCKLIQSVHFTMWTNQNSKGSGLDLGGGCRGCKPPPPLERPSDNWHSTICRYIWYVFWAAHIMLFLSP